MFNKESNILKSIRLWCGENNILCFRCNVGGGKLANGGYFNSGLPNGFSDLIVLPGNGFIIFVECKNATGRQREDQIMFQTQVESRGYKYLMPRSLEDFVTNYSKLIEK